MTNRWKSGRDTLEQHALESTTDPDARLYKKAVGREAKLGYLAHLLTENRHGLIIDTAVTAAGGRDGRRTRTPPWSCWASCR